MTRDQREQDVIDAQLLASYLARNGVQGVEAEITLITQISPPREGSRETSIQLPPEFYTAYQKLAAKAAPVTVASLRDSLSKFRYFPVRAVNLLASALTVLVVLCLFYLGHLHSDWLAMNDLSSRLTKLPAELGESTREAMNEEIADLQRQLKQPVTGTNGIKSEDIIAKLKKLQAEQEQDRLIKPQRDELEENLNERTDSCEKDLKPWELFKSVNAQGPKLPSVRTSLGVPLKSLRMMANLQKVVLPMLYGFLGATVFVLRRVAWESAHRLFRRENMIELMVRPFLGTVAGFVIGWFMVPEKTGVIADATVAPFALAFVAGYSLEVVFTVLDRLTATEKPK